MIQLIIAQLIWILCASLEGVIQAHYYALYPTDKGHKNLHPIYALLRGILLGVIMYGLWWDFPAWQCSVFAVSCFFTFSFWHNGFYYKTRNKLDKNVYPRGWWDDSDTSTALVNISSGFRTAMLVIGIAFTVGLIFEQY